MSTEIFVIIVVTIICSLIIAYVSYRKGYADGIKDVKEILEKMQSFVKNDLKENKPNEMDQI